MQSHPFDHLREPLLRGGVSPRHVTRYLSELAAHYDDAVRDEEQRGAAPREAEKIARARMGDEKRLVEEALMRPELHAYAVRYPWVVYGIGSVIAFVAAIAATVFLTMLFMTIAAAILVRAEILPDMPSWLVMILTGFKLFLSHVLPLIIGTGIVFNAVRQRMPILWPVIGILLISLLSSLTNFDFTLGLPGHWHLNIGTVLNGSETTLARYAVNGLINLTGLLALYAVAITRVTAKSRA